MGGARKLSALLAAVGCAAILAACGGGDSATTGTGGQAPTGEAPSDGLSGGGKESSGGSQSGGGKESSGGGSQSGGSGGEGGSAGGGSGDGKVPASFSGPPTKHDHPTPVEGKRSDVFRVPGGDNSIQEFGEEEDAAARRAAMLPIAALYRAMESGNWSEICSTYLSAKNIESIELLAEKSPQIKGKGCSEVLGGLNKVTGREPSTPDGGIVSFRSEGDTGFAIYWGIDGKGYAFALKSEGGGWKLTSLAPTPLMFG